jgi:hypothetical protein
MPAPAMAMSITPTITKRSAQRSASFAMRMKIANKTTPAMIKMVVNSMNGTFLRYQNRKR